MTTNVFDDQARFMRACDQTVGEPNYAQAKLYFRLIEEEFNELKSANSPIEELDALIDLMVVIAGALHSMGADGEGAWREVMRSNMAKIDPLTGKVRKRGDGKVLKPDGWTPPHLEPYLPPSLKV